MAHPLCAKRLLVVVEVEVSPTSFQDKRRAHDPSWWELPLLVLFVVFVLLLLLVSY